MRDKFSAWGMFTVVSTIIGFIVDAVALIELLRRTTVFQIDNPGVSPSLGQIGFPAVTGQTRLIEGASILVLAYTIVGMTYTFSKIDLFQFRYSLLKLRKKREDQKAALYARTHPGQIPPFTIILNEDEIAERQSFILPYAYLASLFVLPFAMIWFQVFVLRSDTLSWFAFIFLVVLGIALLWLARALVPQAHWNPGRVSIGFAAIEVPLLIAGLLAFTTYSWITIVLLSLLIPFFTLALWAISRSFLLFLAGIHYGISGLLRD